MKNFDKIFIAFFIFCFAFLIFLDLLFPKSGGNIGIFKVESNRAVREISNGKQINLNGFSSISKIFECDDENLSEIDTPYVIKNIDQKLYCIEYKEDETDKNFLKILNITFLSVFAFIFAFLLFIRQNIIKPFNEISELPYALAKGNLTVPLKETRSRYFGKFIWGLDMLREELERSRSQELERIKREKTAMLSISHDIKTPLSAIKLYAKAIEKNLYFNTEKQSECAKKIDAKADEIERYVSELTSKISGEIMDFSVCLNEEYLSSVLNKINKFYSEKFELTGTDLLIENYTDCLISCDPRRLEEVLQNIMENAVKYGDGKFIKIEISDEEDCKLIAVSNSGNTLSETEISHIFDSFWRGSNAQNVSGNGLGLYICRRFMNEMNGDIFANIHENSFCVTVVCRKIF